MAKTNVFQLLAEFGRLSEETGACRAEAGSGTVPFSAEAMAARCEVIALLRGLFAPRCGCGNEARYIDLAGQLHCSLCLVEQKKDGIRISDVPRLLEWARAYLNGDPCSADELRSIIGRDVSR